MFVLFEDGGAFRAGTVLSDAGTSLQVETVHGKRVKIKRAAVIVEFDAPEPQVLLDAAQAGAQELDAAFLWEACEEGEFAVADFAREYFGHAPSAVETATLLFALQEAPVYFHRKGKGRFRKAPPEILQAALAGQARRAREAEQVEAWRAALVAGELPPELRALVPQLLYRPDRNRLETKAFEAACVDAGESPAQLLLRCGALESSYALHLNRFLFEHFPQGTEPPALPDSGLNVAALPLAEVRAFSIDDASTTEIDDAFSVTPLPGGGWRIGIHIAAPALGFDVASGAGQLARSRLSTVYMPGNKITMLPDALVSRFTLGEGRECPAVSLYAEVSPALSVQAVESRVERVPVAANLRLGALEPLFNEERLLRGDALDFPFGQELRLLWELATVLEGGRGKTETTPVQTDYGFAVDWERASPDGEGWVEITTRQRGSPLDKLVSELMIFVNAHWGKQLADAGVAGLYRVQNGGKVRMSTHPEPHEALGVDCYAWSSSPLRRYVDLVNQWQLVALLRGEVPPFAARSADLLAAMRDFEVTYASYAEFQRQMERYWCLRWLRQHGVRETGAVVLRENTVRLDGMPFVGRVPDLPPSLPGARVQLALGEADLFNVELPLRYLRTLSEPQP